jgi:Chaperone of endosialidase
MKKIITLFAVTLTINATAQNVGIGETAPTEAKLQVKTTDSAVAVFQNNTASGINVKTGLFFKTGNNYSGSIGTIGSGATFRMGLFTYGGATPSSLLERISISDGGNVGIGNTNPLAKLDINGQIKINGGTPGAGKLLESDAMGLATWVDKSASYLPVGASGNTLRHTGVGWTANSLLYNNGTNIGIGTTNPSSKLEVLSSGYGILQNDGTVSVGTYTSSTGGWIGTKTNHPLHFFSNNSAERMTLSALGNLGIGTTAPTYILDINGRARLRHNSASSGIWHNKADNTEGIFTGLINDSTYGYFGANGWQIGMDVTNGMVGIGNLYPKAPLSFPSTIGNKIALWGDPTGGHYGIGIQGSLLQLYTSASNADIAFGYGKSSSFAETMRIKGNGKVGIGGISPIDYQLHVLGWPNDKLLQLENTDILDAGINNTIMFQTGGQYTGAIKTIGESSNAASLGFYTGTSGVENGLTKRMTIANSGRVTIGTNSITFNPSSKLHVEDVNITSGDRLLSFFYNRNGTGGAWCYAEIGDYAGGAFSHAIGIKGTASSAVYNTGVDGFAQASTGQAAYGVYGSSGQLGSGTAYGGYFSGTLAYTGSLFNASDATLKTNVKPFENALNSINKLKIKQYEFTADSKKTIATADGEHIGVLAQELQQVFPTLVSKQVQPIFENVKDEKGVEKRTQTGAKEYLGVNYMELIPVLIKGMQEQQVLIEELKKKIEVLENKAN